MASKSKLKRRRFIMIMGVKVKIRYMSKMMCEDEDELHGAFCSEAMTIYISTKSDIPSTLLHECCHAVLKISGVGNMLSEKTEEAIVSAMEVGLRDYFKF